ncbi:threonylcarbamoyl-AMP synthase [Alphaproteobacteria bacterium HT1-32]|nr:threonylcarbamoyl-AMP synthase [Alphaproteobacteria bacterium HT1-32]
MTSIVEASSTGIDRAAGLLLTGGLVAFPTETVYGLGADATDDRAVARIFEAKGRPSFNPLICHLPSFEAAAEHVVLHDMAHVLAERFLPGALTLVLMRRPDCRVSLLASAGLPSLAIRIPAHPIARRLLEQVGRPVAAPSANRSGGITSTSAQHVASSLGDGPDLILDGGPCQIGLESTVLDLTGDQPVLLRPGGVTQEEIEKLTGPVRLAASDDTAPKSPGQLTSHYAPSLPVMLDQVSSQPGGVHLGFGDSDGDLNLSPTGDLVEAAANLFAMMHQLDRRPARIMTIAPIPDTGLGRAINDRLTRAAAPRG